MRSVVGLFSLYLIASSLGAETPLAGARRKTFTPSYNSETVNDTQSHPDVRSGDTGPAVVRLQILLDRAHFSPGEIDGRFGDNSRIAVAGYQAALNLDKT